jgi:antirestriction protein
MNAHRNDKSTESITPRIYVASLADYNAGRLHGRWIEAAQPFDDIRREVADMLAESREPIAEEWAIHDYEGFGSLRLAEYEDLERVAEVASALTEHGPLFAELVNHVGGLEHIDEATRYLEEAYQGEFDSLTDYAEQIIDECYSDVVKDLPDFIRYHIDYEGIGHDMELSGDIFTIEIDGAVHVFHAHI